MTDDIYFYERCGANDRLRGVVVLMHPLLYCDPLNKRNHVGVICEGDIDFDRIYVDFTYNVGLFSADGLLSFLPGDKIHDNLTNSSTALNPNEAIALRRVDALVRFGGVTEKIRAMATARDYPAIQALCVESLQDQISREIITQYSRD